MADTFSKIMQGDEYSLLISVSTEDDEPIETMFSDIELSFGNTLRKTLQGGGIKYDADLGKFKVYIAQAETFGLKSKERMQIRFKFNSGEVVGVDAGVYDVSQSISKVVL